MNILFDLNVILDYLIPARQGHSLAKELYEHIKKQGFTMWLSASSVDNIQYILLATAKQFDLDIDQIKLEFKRYVDEIKIFSVTGSSIRDSLKVKDLEDHIIYTNFKRIAPDGIVISRDAGFQKHSDVISPENFLEMYKKTTSTISTTQPLNHSTPKTIPLLDLQKEYRYMLEDIDHAVLNTVAEARYILGPQVKELEDKIAKYLGVKHCIGISSGTDALVLSLRTLAMKIKGKEYWDKDDHIITTPFTFTATGDAILRSGATPVFVDIDPTTYNIDPKKIKGCIEGLQSKIQHLKSKIVGILPVHLYGQSCNMDEVMKIAKEYNLFVLEDVAQAFGGSWGNKKLGSIGNAGIFSFFPSKNLGGFGDGGMVSTNNDEIAELVRMLLRHGGKDKYNVDHVGYNARLDTLQAAVVLAKFKYIDEFNERRRQIAKIYTRELASIEGLFLPVNNSTSQQLNFSTSKLPDGHVYHQYTVCTSRRDEFQAYLKEKGIASMVYYPFPLHKMKVFGSGRSKVYGNLLNAERATQSILSLPIEPLQSKEDTDSVIDCVKSFFKNKT